MPLASPHTASESPLPSIAIAGVWASLPSTDSFTGLSQPGPPVANAGAANAHSSNRAPIIPASPNFRPSSFGTGPTSKLIVVVNLNPC